MAWPYIFTRKVDGEVDYASHVNELQSALEEIAAGTNPVQFASGTVSAPGVRPASEPTSGLYRVSAGIIAWAILGVERLRLSATELLVSASLRVKGPSPWADVVAYGADKTGVVDATTIIQSAIDAVSAAGGGTVYFPQGTYLCSNELTYPKWVNLVGAGIYATTVRWASDLGSGKYALKPSAVAGTYNDNTIRGIYFQGPFSDTSRTYGTALCVMRGIRLGRRTLVDRCQVKGFNMGLAFGEDHAWLKNSTLIANDFNVGWISASNLWGDQSIESCDLTGASISSIRVEDGTYMGATLIDVHLGNAPYGIDSTTGRVTTSFIVGSLFIDVAFEGFGNAAIHAGTTTDVIDDTMFVGGGGWVQDSTYKVAATTYDHIIEAGKISSLILDCNWNATAPASSFIYSSGNQLQYIQMRQISGTLLSAAASAKPILARADGGASVLCTWKHQETGGFFAAAGAALAVGQLARRTGRDNVNLFDTSGQMPAGFARHACGANEIVAIMTSGYTALPIANAAISAQKFIKPANSAGRVIEATDFSDGPIVGQSINAAGGAASTFQVDIGGVLNGRSV